MSTGTSVSQYMCSSGERREAVRAARGADGKPVLNGIDFLEVVSDDQRTLALHFLHPLPGSGDPEATPAAAPALTDDNIVIEGGVRSTHVAVLSPVVMSAPDVLTITVDAPGDFSTYTLRLATSKGDPVSPDYLRPPRGFDPQTSAVQFSFKVECPNDFDCAPDDACPVEPHSEPDINYLAKDYASFRQLMLDRMSVLAPGWRDRNVADGGIALVELMAYMGDYLSYQQDAVATEAYLDTARRRVSVRRHARLVDYTMHDGCNARAWVQVRVSADVIRTAGTFALPKGTRLLTRAPDLPLRIPSGSEAAREAPQRSSVVVFETMAPMQNLYQRHNTLHFYTWGEVDCCLPAGATRATLRENVTTLRKGDMLVLVEAVGPLTGVQADADPTRRCAVRLTSVVTTDRDNNPLTDPLTGQAITEIEWHQEDNLPFPFCLSSQTDMEHGDRPVGDVSVALGNIVLADHGRSLDVPDDLGEVPEPRLFRVPVPRLGQGGAVVQRSARRWQEPSDEGSTLRPPVPPRYRPALHDAPLTFATPYPYASTDATPKSATAAMQQPVESATPDIFDVSGTLDGQSAPWFPQPDLLNSADDRREFVVEVEADGVAWLRFGDNQHGMRPAPGTAFTARYRVGNGTRGNIGRDALYHVVSDLTEIESVSNPLPARGGVDPESVASVRQRAPFAFRHQERAVTMADYAEVAERHPGVQRAAATKRWTGSWHTVFMTIDRIGGLPVDADFETDMRQFLDRYRMAGYDVEIDNPRLVPIEIEMRICVDPDYFRSQVTAALLQVFSSRVLPDGRPGVFHPDNFTFGQPVYLSPLYAAAEQVAGVQSAQITVFQRQDRPETSALDSGVLSVGRLEIATLANDPNFPDRGVFRLKVEGGK
jgi:hypothetical protein